jgi:hypothetical protein
MECQPFGPRVYPVAIALGTDRIAPRVLFAPYGAGGFGDPPLRVNPDLRSLARV